MPTPVPRGDRSATSHGRPSNGEPCRAIQCQTPTVCEGADVDTRFDVDPLGGALHPDPPSPRRGGGLAPQQRAKGELGSVRETLQRAVEARGQLCARCADSLRKRTGTGVRATGVHRVERLPDVRGPRVGHRLRGESMCVGGAVWVPPADSDLRYREGSVPARDAQVIGGAGMPPGRQAGVRITGRAA